ncbi:MAG: DUF3369 domain-containing protein [Spirochaetes bacterium]|nr:DUF3369 domain-containing protein [Spirochaetota bacterium]
MSDDLLVFANEEEKISATVNRERWRVLIVDDEEDVHKVTQMVLGDVVFQGKKIEFLSCYSAKEAMDILSTEKNIAVILLDVVMEEDDSGLKLVKFIRNDLKNKLIRIILRTGQPGQAPEEKVVVEYDINDYKSKPELTSEKLFTTVISSIRSYRDLLTIEKSRTGLEKIIEASSNIFEIQSLKKFVSGALLQMISLLKLDSHAVYAHTSGLTFTNYKGRLKVLAAAGKYNDAVIDRGIDEVVQEDVSKLIRQAIAAKKTIFNDYQYVGFFKSKNESENIIYLEKSDPIDEWEKDLIDIFCSNVAIAFDNIYLNMELEDTQREIVFTLGEIAENRSRETHHHVKRVGEYSKFLALQYNISADDAEILKVASAMHDLGKISVPDKILNKPGKLTADEFEIMKMHTINGGDMLKYSKRSILQLASVICYQHHEKWDGTGYPYGLKGKDINVFAKITAIADVFDALISDRVYRKAIPLDEVLVIMKEQKGKNFDPELMDIFLNNIDEILKIKEMLLD